MLASKKARLQAALLAKCTKMAAEYNENPTEEEEPEQLNESVIRKMTRLAKENNATNLSQGFGNDSPDFEVVWATVCALVAGSEDQIPRIEEQKLDEKSLMKVLQVEDQNKLASLTLKDLMHKLQGRVDVFNQYCDPYGTESLRKAIAVYYERFYSFTPDYKTRITVTLGATEGMSAVLRAMCKTGDRVVIFEPCNEMYANQAALFGLEVEYLTLQKKENEEWRVDCDAVTVALAKPRTRVLIMNNPHNPTGTVFSNEQVVEVAGLCQRYDVSLVMDDIYEHVYYGADQRPVCLLSHENLTETVISINSISKTGAATGWRVGWVVASENMSNRIRNVHDCMAMQAPTPLQRGAEALLRQPDSKFQELRATYQAKRRVLLDGLRSVGFEANEPNGTYYIFAKYKNVKTIGEMSPTEAAMHLVEKVGVAVVPGDNFFGKSEDGKEYLRFAFCRNISQLEEACAKLATL
eukprot:Platyproteum_vivax@DN3262_c0_g1_i1.p1